MSEKMLDLIYLFLGSNFSLEIILHLEKVKKSTKYSYILFT